MFNAQLFDTNNYSCNYAAGTRLNPCLWLRSPTEKCNPNSRDKLLVNQATTTSTYYTAVSMSISSFFSSFLTVVHADASEEKEKVDSVQQEAPATAEEPEAEPQEEQTEPEAEEPEDVCHFPNTPSRAVLSICSSRLATSSNPRRMQKHLQMRIPDTTL